MGKPQIWDICSWIDRQIFLGLWVWLPLSWGTHTCLPSVLFKPGFQQWHVFSKPGAFSSVGHVLKLNRGPGHSPAWLCVWIWQPRRPRVALRWVLWPETLSLCFPRANWGAGRAAHRARGLWGVAQRGPQRPGPALLLGRRQWRPAGAHHHRRCSDSSEVSVSRDSFPLRSSLEVGHQGLLTFSQCGRNRVLLMLGWRWLLLLFTAAPWALQVL